MIAISRIKHVAKTRQTCSISFRIRCFEAFSKSTKILWLLSAAASLFSKFSLKEEHACCVFMCADLSPSSSYSHLQDRQKVRLGLAICVPVVCHCAHCHPLAEGFLPLHELLLQAVLLFFRCFKKLRDLPQRCQPQVHFRLLLLLRPCWQTSTSIRTHSDFLLLPSYHAQVEVVALPLDILQSSPVSCKLGLNDGARRHRTRLRHRHRRLLRILDRSGCQPGMMTLVSRLCGCGCGCSSGSRKTLR